MLFIFLLSLQKAIIWNMKHLKYVTNTTTHLQSESHLAFEKERELLTFYSWFLTTDNVIYFSFVIAKSNHLKYEAFEICNKYNHTLAIRICIIPLPVVYKYILGNRKGKSIHCLAQIRKDLSCVCVIFISCQIITFVCISKPC